ncbi:hypothetical protein MMC31_002940 [Peltigera leucophlebia]|nr:hypothetical protein [Peltigera leucophlebia]
MYKLTKSDLCEPSGPEGLPAIIRASKLPDRRVLEALLKLDSPQICPSSFLEAATAGYCTSALHAAIKARLPANVSLLLSHGADPNGLPPECFSDQSVRFLRFRHPRWSAGIFPVVPPREDALAMLPHPQTDPLTEEEIDARRTTRARFWAEPSMPVFGPSCEAMTALESAAAIGDIQIFDELLNAGADTAAWKWEHPYKSIHTEPSVSYLSILTPLHHAVEANQLIMIHHLLDLKFATNNFPLASITCALSPAMTAIASLNLPAYHLLAPHSDLTLTTPIYNIHILHLAAATLSLDIFLQVAKTISLDTVPPTALLHTLLHIVCLPLNDSYINHHSAKCHSSIHELRCLDRNSRNETLHPHPPPNQFLRRRPNSSPLTPPLPSLSSDDSAQTALLLHLLHHTSTPLSAQDIHGNTPLHYLAGYRNVNNKLLQILLSEENGFGAESVWAGSRNRWGFTPKELFEEGDEVKESEELYMPFWRDRMGYWRGSNWVDLLQDRKATGV